MPVPLATSTPLDTVILAGLAATATTSPATKTTTTITAATELQQQCTNADENLLAEGMY